MDIKYPLDVVYEIWLILSTAVFISARGGKIKMKKRIPTSQVALEIVAPISPHVYRGFEHGISKTKLHFKTEGIEHDPWAFAMLVKLHAREYLRKCSEFASVVIDRMSLCGISLHYQDCQLRLWRSADHQNPRLPSPGRSKAKKLYYVQPKLFPEMNEAPSESRFVILWDVDRDGNLETLWLVCPKNFNQKNGEITVHWAVELPNPILGIRSSPETVPAPELPYKPKQEKQSREG